MNKLVPFQAFTLSSNYSVLVITESWCSSNIFDNEIIPPNFVIFRNDRDSRGGGVFIAVHNSIPSRLITSPTPKEIIAVEILLPHPVVLCAIYIPPKSSTQYVSSWVNILSDLVTQHNTILLGDFNFPDINWDTISSSSPQGNLFCEFIFDHSLRQFINAPTHVAGNILDLVLCEFSNLIIDTKVCSNEPFPGLQSDHNLISISLSSKLNAISSKTSHPQYIYRKGVCDGFNQFIFSTDLSSFYESTDIEFKWLFLKSLILRGCELYIPKMKPNRNDSLPKWLNRDTKSLLRKVRLLRKKVHSSPTVNNVMSLKISEQQLSDTLTSSKLAYESKLVHDSAANDNNRIYKYIRKITKQSSLPSSLHFESLYESSNLGVATIFNKFFHSVFNPSVIPPTVSDDCLPSHSDSISISEIDFSVDDVFKSLHGLNSTKAMGIDNIHNYILKYGSPSLSYPIHHLFTECIYQSYLPCEWRTHKVVPIYKSGDKSSVKNYRPISLLCCISKVLERIIFDRIYDNISPLISTHQFGFMKNRSTVQQLIQFSESISSSISRKNSTDVIYFDIKKAFDSVPHDQLLTKLQETGITDSALNFFPCLSIKQTTVCVHQQYRV